MTITDASSTSPIYNDQSKGFRTMRSLKTSAIAFIALGSLLVTAFTPLAGHAASTARSAAAVCAVPRLIGHQTCYGAAQVAAAERQAPWAMRPDTAMNLTFGIKLRQVSVIRLPNGRNVAEIEYLYGPLRHDYGRQWLAPVSIRIVESRTRTDERRFAARWTHTVCGQKVEISPAADPNRSHPAYGPWYLIANLPHRSVSIGIVANTDQGMLSTLACRMLPAR